MMERGNQIAGNLGTDDASPQATTDARPFEKISLDHLKITPADTGAPMPLYHQVSSDLRTAIQALIHSGRFSTGDMLPPEVELAKAYGVGRQTIREAIARLVDENLLERFAGRGTFIRSHPNRTRFYLNRSFTQQMAELGLTAHSEVLRVYSGSVDENSPRALRGKHGSPCLHLTRLRMGDDEPVGVQYTIILTERCPGMERFDFNQESLYNVLAREYQLMIVEINHEVNAVTATEFFAGLLATAPGAPLLLVKTVAYLEGGEPIETTTSYYRADKYEFSIVHAYHDCD
jgi:GntR family transcriptional regulator